MSDAFPEKLAPYTQKGIKVFKEGEDLIKSGEVDAVVIATSAPSHYALAKKALEADKAVYVEKPLCQTIQ